MIKIFHSSCLDQSRSPTEFSVMFPFACAQMKNYNEQWFICLLSAAIKINVYFVTQERRPFIRVAVEEISSPKSCCIREHF